MLNLLVNNFGSYCNKEQWEDTMYMFLYLPNGIWYYNIRMSNIPQQDSHNLKREVEKALSLYGAYQGKLGSQCRGLRTPVTEALHKPELVSLICDKEGDIRSYRILHKEKCPVLHSSAYIWLRYCHKNQRKYIPCTKL